MKKTQTKELTITKEINPLLLKAQTLEITSPKDMISATEILSQANKFLDKLTEDKEKMTKPINELLKEIRAKYKPNEEILTNIIKNIRLNMSTYQTEQLRLKRIDDEKIAARVAKGTLKVDTAIAKMEENQGPDQTIASDSGQIKFRTDKKLKITDPLAIPREYLEINEKEVLDALKLGKSIPGAEIELIQIPINSRN